MLMGAAHLQNVWAGLEPGAFLLGHPRLKHWLGMQEEMAINRRQ